MFQLDSIVLVEGDADYPRSKYELLHAFRPTQQTVGQPFFLRYQSPPPQLFEDTFFASLPIQEAFQQQTQQAFSTPWFIWQKSPPAWFFDDPFFEQVRYTKPSFIQPRYAIQFAGFTVEVPDFNDHPWLEWVHPAIDHNAAFFPFRIQPSLLPGQPQFLLGWKSKFDETAKATPEPYDVRTPFPSALLYHFKPFVYLDIYDKIFQVVNEQLIVQPSVDWIHHPTIPYQKVISVVPPDAGAPPWTPIHLIASMGPEPPPVLLTVPNVVGLQVYLAESACTAAGLSLSQRVYVSTAGAVPFLYIVAQSIAGGTVVANGTNIQLTVSTG